MSDEGALSHAHGMRHERLGADAHVTRNLRRATKQPGCDHGAGKDQHAVSENQAARMFHLHHGFFRACGLKAYAPEHGPGAHYHVFAYQASLQNGRVRFHNRARADPDVLVRNPGRGMHARIGCDHGSELLPVEAGICELIVNRRESKPRLTANAYTEPIANQRN